MKVVVLAGILVLFICFFCVLFISDFLVKVHGMCFEDFAQSACGSQEIFLFLFALIASSFFILIIIVTIYLIFANLAEKYQTGPESYDLF